jgi:hypothetical protein
MPCFLMSDIQERCANDYYEIVGISIGSMVVHVHKFQWRLRTNPSNIISIADTDLIEHQKYRVKVLGVVDSEAQYRR